MKKKFGEIRTDCEHQPEVEGEAGGCERIY